MAATKSREAKLTEAAQARGFELVKVGRKFKLVSGNGTLVADDWTTGEGLTLDEIDKALSGQ